jgi:hypothetical protein
MDHGIGLDGIASAEGVVDPLASAQTIHERWGREPIATVHWPQVPGSPREEKSGEL